MKNQSELDYLIALEGIGAKLAGYPLKPLAAKHGISVNRLEDLIQQGLNGIKSAFLGNPELSSNAAKLAGLTDDSEEIDHPLRQVTPVMLIKFMTDYNDLATEKDKPLVAITAGKVAELTGLSLAKAKDWVKENSASVKKFNDKYGVTSNTNKSLKGFDFWQTYDDLKR